MNATTDAKATAQTALGWRHIGWPLLFCSCCDYSDRFAGLLRIVEKPARRADVFETAGAPTPAATGKLRSRYVKSIRTVVKSAANHRSAVTRCRRYLSSQSAKAGTAQASS